VAPPDRAGARGRLPRRDPGRAWLRRQRRAAALEAYDMESLIGDVLGLIDHFGEKQAILIGHDWGAPIVWNTTALHPGRVRAVAALSVPYSPRGKTSSIALWRRIYAKRFFYQLYFQQPGKAEAEFEADVRTALRKIYYSGSGDAPRGMFRTTSRWTRGCWTIFPIRRCCRHG